MADETTSTDKPLASLVDAEQHIDPPAHEPDEPISAVDRLRAFEDEKVGKDAPRIAGALERGIGSLWHRMSEDDKAMHAKIEKLIAAEDKLAAAHTALIAADAEHEAAEAAVNG